MHDRQAGLDTFKAHFIAHRGLFDNDSDHPENSLAAFARAVDAGYGIELDVQLTKDAKLVVFHDADLARMCGEDVKICELTYKELAGRRLAASDQAVPLFRDVLDVIGGRVPLVTEIKSGFRLIDTCRLTHATLNRYDGPYCIESFDPRALAWFRWRYPDIIRGQLAEDFSQDPATGVKQVDTLLTNMVPNAVTWPDFVAFNHLHADVRALRFWREVLSCALVAWTIKSQDELDAAKSLFDVFIFDSFIPKGKPGE